MCKLKYCPHCPKNILDLHTKTKPLPVRADMYNGICLVSGPDICDQNCHQTCTVASAPAVISLALCEYSDYFWTIF